MKSLASINREFDAWLKARHPDLAPYIEIDLRFSGLSSFGTMFTANVHVTGTEAYMALKPLQPAGADHILWQLFDYQVFEPAAGEEFTVFDGMEFTVGDGDDSLAVVEVGPWDVDIWVRLI